MDNTPYHDGLSALKGVDPDQSAPAQKNDITSKPRSDSNGAMFAPTDSDLPDLDFDILRMDSATRPAGEFEQWNMGNSLVASALVQAWREERKRGKL